jgi:hypothetical protein
MARKRISLVEDNKTAEEKLQELIPHYQLNKHAMDSYKKVVDKDNKEIKMIMLESQLPEFIVGDIKATCSVSEREDFIEEALIEKLKDMKVKGVIKKKEYVDMDALENAIYNGELNAAELTSCQTKKEVVTLRITKIKEKK